MRKFELVFHSQRTKMRRSLRKHAYVIYELRTIRALDNSDLGQFGPDSDLSCGQFGPWSIRTLVNSDLDHWSIRTP